MLGKNEIGLLPYLTELYEKIVTEEFVFARNEKIVELISPRIVLDPRKGFLDFGVRKTPVDYVKAELKWYDSQDRNIEEISKSASLWKKLCSTDGNVNSNYGWCIYSKENYSQYENCFNEIINDPDSRRAVMIYQRPSMWNDYKEDGRNDFICTDGVQIFIRDLKIYYVVKQRSCDFIYGFFNDYAWHCTVYERLKKDILERKPEIISESIPPEMIYIPFSFHVYEKHFDLLKKIVMENLHWTE